MHTQAKTEEIISLSQVSFTMNSWANNPNKCKYKHTMSVYNIQHLLVNFKLSALDTQSWYSVILEFSQAASILWWTLCTWMSLCCCAPLPISPCWALFHSAQCLYVCYLCALCSSLFISNTYWLSEWEFMLWARALHCANHSHLYCAVSRSFWWAHAAFRGEAVLLP